MMMLKKKPTSVEQILTSFNRTISDLDVFSKDQETQAGSLEAGALDLRREASAQEEAAKEAREEAQRAQSIRTKLARLVGSDG